MAVAVAAAVAVDPVVVAEAPPCLTPAPLQPPCVGFGVKWVCGSERGGTGESLGQALPGTDHRMAKSDGCDGKNAYPNIGIKYTDQT